MSERQKFEQNLNVCRQYVSAMVKWLRAIGLDEDDVDRFEAYADTTLSKAGAKIPPPAKIIDIKDYL